MSAVAPTITWSLGDRLEKARRAAGLQQNELAQAIGVSRQLISKWERDKSEPSASQVVDFAEACNVDVLWILGLAGNTTCFTRPLLTLVPPPEGQMVLPVVDL